MNPLDNDVQALIAMIRAAGGSAGISPNAPDSIKRAFLQSILECPECRAAVMGKHEGNAN
ncbi:MAG TPA: hypothetical protein VMU17_01865 [Elusimicrobiota bacterium]|nr:hypothetical protein [Elusimicrobiota bacterium]